MYMQALSSYLVLYVVRSCHAVIHIASYTLTALKQVECDVAACKWDCMVFASQQQQVANYKTLQKCSMQLL
jgi:hypothetical protein